MTTLAELIALAGAGEATWDARFGRALAKTLADHRDRLWIAPIERLGLVDVAVTFHMRESLRVVVTGRLAELPGEVSIHWSESDLALVEADFRGLPEQRESYLVCSLDFSYAGRAGTMLRSCERLTAGQRVKVRARVTVGADESWRLERGSAPIDAVALDHDD